MVTNAAKWRIGLLLVTILLLVLALVGQVARYAIRVHADVAESAPLHLIPNTDLNPYGANFFLQWEADPFKREKTVELAAEAGIGWAKQQFPWEDIEPSPGQYRWEKYDDIVDLYHQYGLEVIARLDRPPDWTRADDRFAQRPPDDFNDYGDFVEAFVRHFSGRVRYIQIWNEPNIFPEWGDQPVDPVSYVALLSMAYRRAKRVDPGIYVLSAPLAINVEDFPGRRNLSDLIYLEEMYAAGAASYFDILSANAFGMDRPPWDPPDPRVLNLRRIELQRDIMERYGDGDKPVWFNEYGWNAAPANFPPEKLIWRRVSEEQQAAWTVDGIAWAREHWPWAGVFNIWYFRQIGNISPDAADYYFRIVDVDFTPRRVYYAVQKAAQDMRVARPGFHQETAASVTPDSYWQPRMNPRASASTDITSDTPGARLTFRFLGSGVDLMAYAVGEGRLAVSIDGEAVPALARDGEGHSIVDLVASDPGAQSKIVLARGLPVVPHSLTLEVVAGHVAIDGFVVFSDNRAAFPVGSVLVGSFGLFVAVAMLYREVARITQSLSRS